jgi:prolyl-tRNA synthetase
MVPCAAGEDDVVRCPRCDYAGNIEKATSTLPPVADDESPAEPERFATPGIRTIAALETFEGGASGDRQIKSLVLVADDEPLLAVLRGDHQLNLQKLLDATGAVQVRPAEPTETLELLGAHPGSLGPVGVSGIRIVADEALRGRTNMTTGANENDWHVRGVDVERDVAVDTWADLRAVTAGEACPKCGSPLELVRCVEAGHIFKLGTVYSETFGVRVADQDGAQRPVVMGSYGIGIGRNMAAVAESHHDDKGLVWPLAIAPYEVVITVVKLDDASMEAADRLYRDLKERGVDVLLDDRDARAGVKFADAELIGVPFRVTLGPKALAAGEVELTDRASGQTDRIPADGAAAHLAELVLSQR